MSPPPRNFRGQATHSQHSLGKGMSVKILALLWKQLPTSVVPSPPPPCWWRPCRLPSQPLCPRACREGQKSGGRLPLWDRAGGLRVESRLLPGARLLEGDTPPCHSIPPDPLAKWQAAAHRGSLPKEFNQERRHSKQLNCEVVF